jgi:undecaprenyl-phosphate 4-deoxy-4-formamido-L-arabinose transferase
MSAGAVCSTGSVVVPVYNSGPTLPDLVSRLAAVLPALGPDWELILINDGSRDQSWEVVSRLAEEHAWVRGINLMRNYGQHNALLCGIRAARHEVVVTMDDDLQHPPEELPKLLAKLAEGHDVVYGRPLQEQHGVWRDLASYLTKLALQRALGAGDARHVSAFRVFRTHIREAFANYHSPFVSIDYLLTWGATRFAWVAVQHAPRRAGVSNYTFRMLLLHALNVITSFSTWPLQLASLIGFAFTVFGFGVLAYVIGRYVIEGGSVPGFPFLASMIAIFSGAQLFALGVMGEYLARIFTHSLGRPTYTVRGTTPAIER